jgi:DNA polymerase III subunit gamma/tau
MAYQVLARKWRPKNFSEMAGQTHVLQTLIHALENQRLHHAYLFTGTRGVGKTTVARILARCLNCEQGISATPCGQCDACREISEGRFIDLIEVDAASRTKVEDTRELLENVQYAPARGRFKVYLIDEVHMLSSHSFNALLKTLEEPPAHVKFLLATTDPQKLPITVLSRCLQFHLKNLSPAQIVTYLQSVLAAEQVGYEEDALWQLARAAAGSMRDALTLLDQSISFGAGKVEAESVASLLGTPDFTLIFLLIDALAERNPTEIIKLLGVAAENNPDYQRLLEHMLSVFYRITLAQLVPDAVDNSEGDRERVVALAASLSPEDAQLYYQICMQSLQELIVSPDRKISFDMCLLRMFAFSPDVFMNRDHAADQKKKPELSSSIVSTPPVVAPVIVQALEPEPMMDVQALEPEPMMDVQALEPEPIMDEQAFVAPDWFVLVSECHLSGISGNILWNCLPSAVQPDRYVLVLDELQSALFNADHADIIAAALSESLGRKIKVEINIGPVSVETPAVRRRREKAQALEALHQRFYQDHGVMSLIASFDATIDKESLEVPRSQSA